MEAAKKTKLDYYKKDNEDTKRAFIMLEFALASLQVLTEMYIKFDAGSFYHSDDWYYYDCITANGIGFTASINDDLKQDSIRFQSDEEDSLLLTLNEMSEYITSKKVGGE